jgi:hypothetical protein
MNSRAHVTTDVENLQYTSIYIDLKVCIWNDLGGRPFVAEHGPRQSVDTHGRWVHRINVIITHLTKGKRYTWLPRGERAQPDANSTTKDGIYSLLERINMNKLDDRGHGQGRPPRRKHVENLIHGEEYGIVLVGAAGRSSPLVL